MRVNSNLDIISPVELPAEMWRLDGRRVREGIFANGAGIRRTQDTAADRRSPNPNISFLLDMERQAQSGLRLGSARRKVSSLTDPLQAVSGLQKVTGIVAYVLTIPHWRVGPHSGNLSLGMDYIAAMLRPFLSHIGGYYQPASAHAGAEPSQACPMGRQGFGIRRKTVKKGAAELSPAWIHCG